jgi:hypothetical protein
MVLGKSISTVRGLMGWAGVLCATTMVAAPAQARPFHLWAIQEIYSNNSGTLQFIELTDQFGGQNLVPGNMVSVSNAGNTQTNSFTVPGNNLVGNTLDHMLLFGTAGIQAAGGPAPDYIIPNDFLFTGGGSINFFGLNSGTYTALPTDGILARMWQAGDIPNVETNFSGVTGSITPVPEPTTMMLTPFAVGLGGLFRWLSRRRAPPSSPANAANA